MSQEAFGLQIVHCASNGRGTDPQAEPIGEVFRPYRSGRCDEVLNHQSKNDPLPIVQLLSRIAIFPL